MGSWGFQVAQLSPISVSFRPLSQPPAKGGRRSVKSTVKVRFCVQISGARCNKAAGMFVSRIRRDPSARRRFKRGRRGFLSVHRRRGRRWTHAATKPVVQNGGGESPPSFWTLCTRKSGNLPGLWCQKARRHPLRGCPSPVGTAMHAVSHPTDSSERRRRVSSTVLDAWVARIGEAIRAVLPKGERGALHDICPPGLLRYLGSIPPLPHPLSLLPKVYRSFHVFERVETARSGPLATHL